MQHQCTVSSGRRETERHYKAATERVIQAMRDHLDEAYSLDDMSRTAIMSPFHFNRVFSQLTGVPPCRFLTALRLERAKRLLLTTQLSVTDISLDVGYNSLGTFIRRFTELVGLSPGGLRQLAGSGARATINTLRQGEVLARLVRRGRGLHGRVDAPEGFAGPIFIGLSRSAVPQGRPLACSLAVRPGPFRLPPVEDGVYHLVTTALAWSLNPTDYLLYEGALRGGQVGQPVRVEGGEAVGEVVLKLRPPEVLDPPILMTLPLLVRERLGQSEQAPAAEAVN